MSINITTTCRFLVFFFAVLLFGCFCQQHQNLYFLLLFQVGWRQVYKTAMTRITMIATKITTDDQQQEQQEQEQEQEQQQTKINTKQTNATLHGIFLRPRLWLDRSPAPTQHTKAHRKCGHSGPARLLSISCGQPEGCQVLPQLRPLDQSSARRSPRLGSSICSRLDPGCLHSICPGCSLFVMVVCVCCCLLS